MMRFLRQHILWVPAQADYDIVNSGFAKKMSVMYSWPNKTCCENGLISSNLFQKKAIQP